MRGTIPRREQAVFTFGRGGMPMLRRNCNDRSGTGAFRAYVSLPRVQTFVTGLATELAKNPTLLMS